MNNFGIHPGMSIEGTTEEQRAKDRRLMFKDNENITTVTISAGPEPLIDMTGKERYGSPMWQLLFTNIPKDEIDFTAPGPYKATPN